MPASWKNRVYVPLLGAEPQTQLGSIMKPRFQWVALSCCGLLYLTFLVGWNGSSTIGSVPAANIDPKLGFDTPLGFKTYREIDVNVFIPQGYKIRDETFVPALDYIHPPICANVFTEWLAAGSEKQDESATPPKEIPAHLIDKFTLDGYTLLVQAPFWRDERSGIRTDIWSESRINDLLPLDIADPKIEKYQGEGRGLYYAMKAYSDGVSGKSGAVIGSTDPWVEIYALKLNASHITTMEYMKLQIEHPKMSYEHPVQVAKNYDKHIEAYDWIATYSSLEHSGLGRYGDALDPIGDFKESLKMYCMLKKGGHVFLGLPIGYDTVYFNWHRIYGRIRLAIMAAGFDLIEIFHVTSRYTVEGFGQYFKRDEPGVYYTPVAVLRKR